MREAMRIRRAVVTGPTGAIGSALVEELANRSVEVIAVCRENSARADAVPKHPLVRSVACNAEHYAELPAMVGGKADAFFHLAWSGTYGAERNDLYRQLENVRYTLDAVEAAHTLTCSVFVGAGSQSEFGHVEQPLSSALPTQPDNGYGAAKLSACHFSRVRCEQLGLRQEWCRVLSAFGPRDGAFTMMMSTVYKLLRGEHVAMTKGDQVWDFLYSRDAAAAFADVAERGLHGKAYTVGSGQTRTLAEYMRAVRNAIDPSAELGFGELPYYPHQIMHLEADLTELTADTGFRPRYTFEQGVAETVAWARERLR